MIALVSVICMAAGLVTGWSGPTSRLSLVMWSLGLVGLVLSDGWAVNIALTGVVVGSRATSIVKEAL